VLQSISYKKYMNKCKFYTNWTTISNKTFYTFATQKLKNLVYHHLVTKFE